MGHLLRSTNLWGFAALVRDLGGDPDDSYVRHGIRPGIEAEDEAFVPMAAFQQMLDTTAAELDCPDLGLRLSAWQGLDILGPVAVIARNSDTVRTAWESIARYLYVHSPSLLLALSATDPETGELEYHFRIDDPGTPYSVQGYELSLANGARILGFLGGKDSHPSTVAFFHGQHGSTAAYDETFGGAVLFHQDWCGFSVPDGLARRRVDHADAETRRVATRYLEDRFVPDELGLTGRVAELVRRLLPTGHCDTEAVAAQLRLHPRTLQRRLAEESTTFAAVLDAERREQAARLLAHPGLQLGQVAAMLGYSEQSAFTRAFGRWYATSPGRFRAEIS